MPATLVLFDADGDGDQDLALGSLDKDNNPRDRLLLNDGTGLFTFSAAERFPLRYGSADHGTVEMHAGDFDGDQDIIAAVHGPLVTATVVSTGLRFYQNDGAGQFTDASALFFPATGIFGEVVVRDLDQDNDLDLLAKPGFGSGRDNQIYLNDGSGSFKTPARRPHPI